MTRVSEARLAWNDDRGRATDRFGASIDNARSLSLPWDEADAWHTWGRLVVQDGDPSGNEKLDEAIAIYRRMGAGQPWIDRVEESRATL